jgi:hypothetical protein
MKEKRDKEIRREERERRKRENWPILASCQAKKNVGKKLFRNNR